MRWLYVRYCIIIELLQWLSIVLRRDDDIPQLGSASTGMKRIGCDGSGGGGDGHIRTAATRGAGSAAAVHLSNYRKEYFRVKYRRMGGTHNIHSNAYTSHSKIGTKVGS